MPGRVELELALEIPDLEDRLEALVELLPLLGEALLTRAAEEILRVAEAIANVRLQQYALNALLPYVSGALLERTRAAIRSGGLEHAESRGASGAAPPLPRRSRGERSSAEGDRNDRHRGTRSDDRPPPQRAREAAAPPPASRSPRARRRRRSRPVVSHGFSDVTAAERPLAPERTLGSERRYYFWLEIGEPVPDSVTATRVELPAELLPSDVELDVLLIAGPGGFTVPGDAGKIRVTPDEVRVTQPVARPDVSPALLARRLLFAVTAPTQPGVHHLWCHVHHRGQLVQSHHIEATVTATPRNLGRRAVVSRMDYTLSTKLTPGSLSGFTPHRLSIAAGRAPTGSHGFCFAAGASDFRREASFDGQEVQDLIDRARRAFRMVSWGTPDAWRSGDGYRYEQPALQSQLTADLARLAIAGYRNYDAMIDRLGGDCAALAAAMRTPGTIQLALKESARLVLPIALSYDHRLDVDGALDSYSLCEQFSRSTGDLERHPCFAGDCPVRDVPACRTVCPSGFWGFRHEIGVPPTLGTGDGAPADLPAMLSCPSGPTVIIAIASDPQLRERDGHIRSLLALLDAPATPVADTRPAVLELMRTRRAHLVYFYCHGGVDDDVPYLQVGAPGERLSRATLRSAGIRWIDPRALVFVNGCHTTDLEPERAIDLVTGFIQTARSSGVIGTEITVFEPLATAFAEAFIARLLERRTVGAAMRLARLQLLGSWNPLGLLYVPFAMASLRLAPRA